ncbi:MAG: hypothetical protein EKK48_22630 [Candidatus Melainabacteria bacterium]|nr:MAG: hypothetical protein EKK48_22630 [Candidatus Melainabacteria bacterium]
MLKFPNARLLIHNLIAERKLSGEDAIAAGACELGLMSPVEIESVRGQSAAQSDMCGCSRTARLILKKYFDNNDTDAAEAFQKSWESLQERSKKRLGPEAIQATAESHDAAATDQNKSCSQHAPIIFDYLLQEVNRHS